MEHATRARLVTRRTSTLDAWLDLADDPFGHLLDVAL